MLSKIALMVFGEPVQEKLPARVLTEIQARQDASEKLISWVQMALVTLFIALWAASQKFSNMTMTDIQVVPMALGAYFVFTLIRLIASHRVRLPSWYLYLSIIADMALLMLMIWAFHIQYDQPPSFYLKAPTLMYVFIFIALRTLRFEVEYIIAAGATAIVGWSILMWWVLQAGDGMSQITRNFVTYMTSNSVLIGAEIDKMVSIFLVTSVLAIAVVRAQRNFYRSVLKQSAAEDLSRFVSKEVAARITSADNQIQAGDGESRVASIIFTDIEGFSTVSETMTAQELAKTLNEYFGVMGDAISQYGGVITHFEGDLMLITFNAVDDDPNHAENAVKCARMIEKLARSRTFNGAILKTRCGINTGEITVGAVGAQDRLAFTVHGDTVNVAARLEQLNKDYGTYIMMGEATHLAIADNINCEFMCETPVKGRNEKVRVYTLRG